MYIRVTVRLRGCGREMPTSRWGREHFWNMSDPPAPDQRDFSPGGKGSLGGPQVPRKAPPGVATIACTGCRGEAQSFLSGDLNSSFPGLVTIGARLGLTLLPPRRKVTIMVMGNHSAGKSSFINW